MTVTIKASYQEVGTGVNQSTIAVTGLVPGDTLILVAFSGGRVTSVDHLDATSTSRPWSLASDIWGQEAQASVWTYSVDTETSLTVRIYCDTTDPHRHALLLMDGPVKWQIIERFRDGATGASLPVTDFTTTFNTLAGEIICYMLGARNSTGLPTSSRGTVLFHEDTSHTWGFWTEASTGGSLTEVLEAPGRSGHAHYIIRLIDAITPIDSLGPAGSNFASTAPLIALNQVSEAVASQDLIKSTSEPLIPGYAFTDTARPLWFKFQPEVDMWVRFDTELTRPLNSYDSDTLLTVWWLDPNTRRFQLVAQDDDAGIYLTSIVNAHLSAGATYYIRIESWTGSVNMFYVLRTLPGDPQPITPPVQPPDSAYAPVGLQSDGRARFSVV